MKKKIKNSIFLIPWFPGDKGVGIRLCIPGIDRNGAVWLETELKDLTRKEVQELLPKIVKELKNVVIEDDIYG